MICSSAGEVCSDGGSFLTIASITAKLLSPENALFPLSISYRTNPKEKMSDIHTYLTDMLEAKKEGKHPWRRWLKRFGSYYEKKFSKEWDNYEDFWKKALKGKDQ